MKDIGYENKEIIDFVKGEQKMSELINIENLSKSYGKKKALDNINLKINKGKSNWNTRRKWCR